jgi:Protein of unknown function DUF2617
LLATLDLPYADTRAAALSFALGLPRIDAPAFLVTGGVELRLLGASHQVFVGRFSETVACLPGEREPVPGHYSGTADGRAYEFTSTTAVHDQAGFRRAVDDLRQALAGRGDALTGTFPGSPYAVTALALERSRDAADRWIGWRTWHAYPQTREIVMTRSRLVSAR